MSNAYKLNEAMRVLEHEREIVFSSMEYDKLDSSLVRMWVALADMISQVESGDTYSQGLRARIKMLEDDQKDAPQL